MIFYVLLSVKPQSRCRDGYPEPTDAERVEVSAHSSLTEAQQAGEKHLNVELGLEDAPDDEKATLDWHGDWACDDMAEQDYQIPVVDIPDVPDHSLIGVEVAKVGELFRAYNREQYAEDPAKLVFGVIDMIGVMADHIATPSGAKKPAGILFFDGIATAASEIVTQYDAQSVAWSIT
jgi:hypothetical protein